MTGKPSQAIIRPTAPRRAPLWLRLLTDRKPITTVINGVAYPSLSVRQWKGVA